MKLDRNVNPDGLGKYALINLRKSGIMWEEDGKLQVPTEAVCFGHDEKDFFVIRLSDPCAAAALWAYADAAEQFDPEYGAEIEKLAWAAENHRCKKMPDSLEEPKEFTNFEAFNEFKKRTRKKFFTKPACYLSPEMPEEMKEKVWKFLQEQGISDKKVQECWDKEFSAEKVNDLPKITKEQKEEVREYMKEKGITPPSDMVIQEHGTEVNPKSQDELLVAMARLRENNKIKMQEYWDKRYDTFI